jgi:glyoxylate utilization-related uncharacterized protein
MKKKTNTRKEIDYYYLPPNNSVDMQPDEEAHLHERQECYNPVDENYTSNISSDVNHEKKSQ